MGGLLRTRWFALLCREPLQEWHRSEWSSDNDNSWDDLDGHPEPTWYANLANEDKCTINTALTKLASGSPSCPATRSNVLSELCSLYKINRDDLMDLESFLGLDLCGEVASCLVDASSSATPTPITRPSGLLKANTVLNAATLMQNDRTPVDAQPPPAPKYGCAPLHVGL